MFLDHARCNPHNLNQGKIPHWLLELKLGQAPDKSDILTNKQDAEIFHFPYPLTSPKSWLQELQYTTCTYGNDLHQSHPNN